MVNALVGFVGLAPTLAALDRRHSGGGRQQGVDRRGRRDHAAGRAASPARRWCRSTASTSPSPSAWRASQVEDVERVILTASGGSLRDRNAADLGRRDRRGGARASDLEHGGQDHRRQRHAHEQGARNHRGALAVRFPIFEDRGRHPPAVHRAFRRSVRRRFHARADGQARHAAARFCMRCRTRDRLKLGFRLESARVPVALIRAGGREALSVLPAGASPRRARAAPRPTVLSAANEVAVAAFLAGAACVRRDCRRDQRGARRHSAASSASSLEDVMEADRATRRWIHEHHATPTAGSGR